MMNVSNEDLAEYLQASSEAFGNMVEAIEDLNKRLRMLEDTVSKLDRILGNMAIK